jgi:transitional endoplasmic reticulum ATPase
MVNHRTLWRRDFNNVPAAERRLARYALQLLHGAPDLKPRFQDRDFIGALWQLLQSIIDPRAIATVLAPARDQDDDDVLDDWDESPAEPWRDNALRQRLQDCFQSVPPSVMARLAKADGDHVLSPTVALLGDSLALDETACRVLDFLDLHTLSEPLRTLLRECGSVPARFNLHRLAALLGLAEPVLRAALSRRAPLRTLGLIYYDADPSDLEDFIRTTDLLREVLESAPADSAALLALLIEPAPRAAWRTEDFPHLSGERERLRETLSLGAASGATGINALFYGPPGVGKTELARALGEDCGLSVYQIRSDDEDGDGLSRTGRIGAYLMAQRLLARRRDVLLIFDEVEDVFDSGDNLFALLRGSNPTGRQKGWMNRILEDNPVPAIWIANDTSGMDPAFLRRFLLPVAFVTPPRSVRRQMADRHLGDCALSSDLLDELAADPVLTPAQLGAARRLLDLRLSAAPETTVREGVAALRTLLHGAPAPRRRTPATQFDVAYLNLAGQVSPNSIVQSLEREGRGSLCFYGPPGTGKTAFVEVLAEALDRELIACQASDLISPYVGQTEQNLAHLFRSHDPQRTVLFLDEVDSFLSDRRAARHSWERTQVNELLQCLERHPGIFIAATNFMDGIDAAALRRFDFKLHFRPLDSAQRRGLFAREVLGDETAPVPPELARHLDHLHDLTPGDFANVCRQRALLREALTPEQFLKRLAAECRLKRTEARAA